MTLSSGSTVMKRRIARISLFVTAGLIIVAGGYLLVDSLSPRLSVFAAKSSNVVQTLMTDKPGIHGNRLYISRINLDIAITSALNTTDARQVTQSVDPSSSGNFALSARKFSLDLTPQTTRQESPFYAIDQLKMGDQLFVDWNGVRYAYQVSRQYQTTDVQTLTAASSQPLLTLFSTSASGSPDGGMVVEAKQIGTVTWTDGQKPVITLTATN